MACIDKPIASSAIFRAKKLTSSISTPPIDPEALAGSFDVKVYDQELVDCIGTLAIEPAEGIAIIVCDQGISEKGRRRFTIAHELGHYVCHRALQDEFVCSENDIVRATGGKPLEWEANQFAAELLMPEALFSQHLLADGPSYELIPRLAETFQTSLTATAVRYVDLSEENCALILSEKNTIRWFNRSRFFKHYLSCGPLARETNASRFFSGEQISHECVVVDADAWLDDVENTIVYEASYPLQKYGKVLTVLWCEPDDQDEFLTEYDDEILDGKPSFKR